jgi:competence protein ComEA
MLEEIDKGKLVTWLAAGLLILAVALRLHAHAGAGASAATVSVAPADSRAHAAAGASGPSSAAGGSGSGSLWVDVAGAVRRPGLYKVPAGSRVATAIELAGGVSSRGERAAVNLAAPLRDGQQVIVPRRGSAGAVTAGAGGAAGGATAGVGPISLSQATEAQLESLDGIGPALAGRILQYRDQHDGFRSLEELKEVPGIGDKRFEALRRSIVP